MEAAESTDTGSPKYVVGERTYLHHPQAASCATGPMTDPWLLGSLSLEVRERDAYVFALMHDSWHLMTYELSIQTDTRSSRSNMYVPCMSYPNPGPRR